LTVGQNVAGVDAFGAFERSVDDAVTRQLGGDVTLLASSASAGLFSAFSLNAGPVRTLSNGQGLTPNYLDHLAPHVSSVAGEIPPEGLGGGDTAVSMPQAGADQLGLHLSDRFCLELPGVRQPPRWCARLVGLWQPKDLRDPYWTGSPPRCQLAMGRYGPSQLMKLLPARQAVADRRYQASSSRIGPSQAAAVAGQVRQLSSQLRGSGLQVTTSLD